MRIVVYVDGKTYKSPKSERNHKDCADTFYEKSAQFTSFKMGLMDGSVLVLGPDAVKRMHMIFEE